VPEPSERPQLGAGGAPERLDIGQPARVERTHGVDAQQVEPGGAQVNTVDGPVVEPGDAERAAAAPAASAAAIVARVWTPTSGGSPLALVREAHARVTNQLAAAAAW